MNVAIAFIVGVIVGLLVAWYPSRQQLRTCEARVKSLQTSLNENERRLQHQEAEVGQLKGQFSEREETIRDMTAQLDWRKTTIDQLKEVVSERESQIQALESHSVEVIQPDNLQRIEGIGPKISKLLQNAGIMTFSQLAATPVNRLRQILADADLSALADPTTWPEQAKLAAEGDWAGLEALQDELKGGRRT